MNFRKEIASLEKALARKASAKRATDDADIKDWALDIKNNDNSSLMSQIKALEEQVSDGIEADQNDDAMNNNPLEADDDLMADDMDLEADEDMEITASDEDEEVTAGDEDAELTADDDMEVTAADEDEEVTADDDMDVEADEEEVAPVSASKKAADEDEEVTADDEGLDLDSVISGIEEQISDTNDQVIEEVKPESKGGQPGDVVARKRAAKMKYASIIKQATARLDRVASYLEKHGKKSLAFRIDRVSDALEAKLK